MVVRAEVFDIRGLTPRAGDTFLVDTNVWVWLSYSKASIGQRRYQVQGYPPFIARTRSAGAKLIRCGLSLSELANTIEREEFRLYAAVAGVPDSPNARKDFRRVAAERQKVCSEISTAWGQVESLSDFVEANIDAALTTSCLNRFAGQEIDPYDGFLVEAALKAGVPQVLSDDSDMCSVPGIRVFTCNGYAIGKAAAQKMLRTY